MGTRIGPSINTALLNAGLLLAGGLWLARGLRACYVSACLRVAGPAGDRQALMLMMLQVRCNCLQSYVLAWCSSLTCSS